MGGLPHMQGVAHVPLLSSVWPQGQFWHVPLQQVCPDEQAWPQAPQLPASVWVLVQAPLQQVPVPLQVVPSGRVGLEHTPVAGSQVPTPWHWSEAVQTTALPPVQAPLLQV
jgi:hypothetical protein